MGLPVKSIPNSYHASSNNNNNSNSATTHTVVYLQRLIDISQMDIQSALDQMKSLLLPAKMNYVYKMAYYRKQTKDHWARDDPAFVAIQIVMLGIASLAYAIAFRSDSLLGNFIYFTMHSVIINYALSGIILASLARYIANTYLNHSLMLPASSKEERSSFSLMNSGGIALYATLHSSSSIDPR